MPTPEKFTQPRRRNIVHNYTEVLKEEVSSYIIPIDKGLARPCLHYTNADSGDIPEGFVDTYNTMVRADGAYIPRRSIITQCSFSGNIVRFKFWGDGHSYWCGYTDDGKIYFRSVPPSSSSNGGGSLAGTLGTPSTGIFVPYSDTYCAYVSPGNRAVKISSSGAMTNITATTPSNTQCSGFAACEHQGRLLIGQGDKIYYSAIRNIDSGYDATHLVYVGNESLGGEIRYLINLDGNLYVIKQREIWYKSGMYDDMSDEQFRPLVSNIPAIKRAIIGDGCIYLTTKSGFYRFSQGQLLKISTPFDDHLVADTSSEYIPAYIAELGAIVFSSYANVGAYMFHLPSKKWTRFVSSNIDVIRDSDENYGTGVSYLATGTNALKYFQREPGKTGTSETTSSFGCALKTAFSGCGNPVSLKSLRKVTILGTGVDSLFIYGRKGAVYSHSDTTNCWSISAYPDANNQYIGDGDKYFREISIHVEGNADMVVKAIAVTFGERVETSG